MTVRKCARCRQPYEDAPEIGVNAAKSYAPFCSKRCADVDLVHWLKGEYVIDGAGGLAIDEDDGGADAPARDEDGDRF
ncbi:MAG TPA: DNA gyrase inhibitor YacG [Asticcacaulis sp.]|nr:DNA gyrase inhibitor YacG [Asticcacaulis sp.]